MGNPCEKHKDFGGDLCPVCLRYQRDLSLEFCDIVLDLLGEGEKPLEISGIVRTAMRRVGKKLISRLGGAEMVARYNAPGGRLETD